MISLIGSSKNRQSSSVVVEVLVMVVACEEGLSGKGTNKLSGVVEMSHILTGMLVTWMYIFVKTYSIVYLRSVNFTVCTLYHSEKNCGIK